MTQHQTKKIYTLSSIKQMVDINQDIKNFKAFFSLVSTDLKPFEAVIVSQSSLDTDEHLPFQQVDNGQFSGEIISDKNVYQNYFLVMRAIEPVPVELELIFEKLPDYIPQSNDSGILIESNLLSNYKWIILTSVALISVGVFIILKHYPVSSAELKSKSPSIEIPRESILQNLKKLPVE